MKSWILAGVMFSAAAAMGVSTALKVREDAVRNTLASMMSAEENATYTAEVVIREKASGKTTRLRVVRFQGQMSVEPLEGERRGGRGRGPRGPIVDVAILLENYDVAIQNDEILAGRVAKRVTIRPRHPNRPTCTLWVDRERSVLLKHETDERIVETESILFEAKPIERRGGRPDHHHSHYHEARGKVEWRPEGKPERRDNLDLASLPGAASFPVALPTWLPAGFRFYRAGFQKWGSHESLYIVYTDGLTTVSLFEMPANSEWAKKWDWLGKKKDGDCQAGRVKRGGHTMLTVTLDGVVVTVAGTIPEQELVDLMGSFELKK